MMIKIFFLGIALKSVGKYEDAIVNYEKAIILNSQNESYFYNLGITKFNIQKL